MRGNSLKHETPEYKADRDIVLAVVKQKGELTIEQIQSVARRM